MSEKLRASSFFLEEGATVQDDVLKNVVLLGPVSTNGNEYSAEAMKSAVPLYEGHAIYIDHDLKAKARKTHERFGHAENVRFVERDHDGRPRVRGDIPFLRSHPMAATVVEAYQKGRPYFGVSHVCDGTGRKEGRKRFVEQLTSIGSLDLVDKAATCSLVEQEDGGDEPPVPMDPDAHAKEGMVSMVTAIVLGEGTPADKAAKIQALLEAVEGGAAPETPAIPSTPEAPVSEQRLLAKVGELIEQKLTSVLPALVEQGVKDRLAANQYVKPKGTSDPPPAKAQAAADRVPADAKERAAWLRKP